MDKREKRVFLYIAFAIGLYAVVTHLDKVIKMFGYVGNLFTPIVAGLIIAFILNVPVSGFEKLLARLTKGRFRPKGKLIHLLSILLTAICVVLVIAVLGILVIPELAKTITNILEMIKDNGPAWIAALDRYNIDTSYLQKWMNEFNWENMISNISNYVRPLISSIASVASSTVSVAATVISGIIIAIYTLADREKIASQSKRVLYAYAKKSVADRVCYVCALIKDSYRKFLTGQCVEALILGLLIFFAFSVFNLPYAGLIGAVTSVCALIPYIGAFISCALSVILALMISPEKALICLIVYLVVQFIETQFIYPRVVGGSVGLSPLWTLAAVLIGGKLFGLIGMIFFIPLVSVVYILVSEDVGKRLKKKAEDEASGAA